MHSQNDVVFFCNREIPSPIFSRFPSMHYFSIWIKFQDFTRLTLVGVTVDIETLISVAGNNVFWISYFLQVPSTMETEFRIVNFNFTTAFIHNKQFTVQNGHTMDPFVSFFCRLWCDYLN